MLKFLQIVVGALVAFLCARYVDDNLVGAAMMGLLASLAVSRLAMWRHPLVWDPKERTWHYGEAVSSPFLKSRRSLRDGESPRR